MNETMNKFDAANHRAPLELWGGVECSRVRIGNRVVDQLQSTGHGLRLSDLDRIAELGVRTLRYPLLWESHASEPIDWRWADERLNRLRELGIQPILGFVHHGAGPLPGGMLDPNFVSGLANFARQVASRYPWVELFTPVNEPTTTARFSGLYGLWHPHGRDAATFLRCLLQECRATRAAMRAVREVTPGAQLIQTEDIGKAHSTPHMAYQAEHENERRWLTFDLLTGRLNDSHPLWDYLLGVGATRAELEDFAADACPPDVIGMNHYVTSERFLDERLDRYPAETHGGNGRDAYADVAAVRVRAEGLVGPEALLHEIWARYRRPIAITEVQLACVRDEQLRWLTEAWDAATRARAAGVDVRAVTAWALFGACDWDSLLCVERGHYESAAFDVRGTQVRPTAVAAALRNLATGRPIEHPAAAAPGWWRRDARLLFPSVPAPDTGTGTAVAEAEVTRRIRCARPVLIVGADSLLGDAFSRVCAFRGLNAVGVRRRQLQLPGTVTDMIRQVRPWAVIHATRHRLRGAGDAENATGPSLGAELARACREHGAQLAVFSSDLVFDGMAEVPYVESDFPRPWNEHGRAQHALERVATAHCPEALVVRTGVVFGPWDQRNILTVMLRNLAAGRAVRVAADFVMSPSYVPDLVDAVLDLLIDRETGVWHLANQGSLSWYQWLERAAGACNLALDRIVSLAPHDLGWSADRPRRAALASERSVLLPPWEHAMERYLTATPWRAARG
jgi:dTDP-4-dehydrorhamnose reductase